MAIPKVCGVETEYGILARGIELSAVMASSLLVNAYTDHGLALRAWDFADEAPDRDAREGWRPEADYPEVDVLMANSVLTNGARYYVDHAHPEISTPECLTPLEAVVYDRAAEEIIRTSLVRANERLGTGRELLAYKNNSDGKGNSYGCHENYLVDRGLPFGRLAAGITAHFVSRQIFTGAGKVGVENPRDGEPRVGFQLSQRADFFEEPIGLETTVRRPIVNTRDEPHCDAARFRRLHVIVGDANMSEVATWLKLGTTSLVLACMEDGCFPEGLSIVDPVEGIRRVSHDTSLSCALMCVDGRRRTAMELQMEILRCVRRWRDSADDDAVNGESEGILRAWQSVLEGLDGDPLSVADVVDWVAKKRIVDSLAERECLGADHPRLKAVDIQYHDMRPERCLASRVGLRRLTGDGDVVRAIVEPPPTTRAYFRGECIRRWPSEVSSANWDSIVFDTGQNVLQRVPMMDPLKGTRALVGPLLDAARSVDDLLDSLGAAAVEDVSIDPGW